MFLYLESIDHALAELNPLEVLPVVEADDLANSQTDRQMDTGRELSYLPRKH